MSQIVLAIESSCDDTGAAILVDGELKSNIVYSQLDHIKYGGIVPEYASRRHLESIVPVVTAALDEASVKISQITAIACTRGPGLMGSLMVGYTFAKSMAACLGVPLVDVDHMRAHILAHFLEEPKPTFPFLCLTVSGGHTQLVDVIDFDHMTVIGRTLDDAAGEAFDKTGKLLGLPYPAGPLIDRHAQNGTDRFTFSKADITGYDFSFSGFKTSVLYFLRKQLEKDPKFIENHLEDLCTSIQSNIVDSLAEKTFKAVKDRQVKTLAVAGGVSANSYLRTVFTKLAVEQNLELHIPRISFCTDNAAMIGITGWIDLLAGQVADLGKAPDPRLKSMLQ